MTENLAAMRTLESLCWSIEAAQNRKSIRTASPRIQEHLEDAKREVSAALSEAQS